MTTATSVKAVQAAIFFFNDTATTEIYTLSLHDALPISRPAPPRAARRCRRSPAVARWRSRSEEHTSELQSRQYLVCRLLLEKKQTLRVRPIQPARCRRRARRLVPRLLR